MSAATLSAVSPATAAAAPATRVRRSAMRAGQLPRDAAPAGGQAVLYVPPRRFRFVASGAPAAVPHEVRFGPPVLCRHKDMGTRRRRAAAHRIAPPTRAARAPVPRRVGAVTTSCCRALLFAIEWPASHGNPRFSQEPQRTSAGDCSAALRTPTTALEIGRQLGGKGGGAAVLEKGGLDLRQSSSEFQAKTDDTGGDGGNGGKISNGGSGGDGDEGDDDDYFDDGDEEARLGLGCAPPPGATVGRAAAKTYCLHGVPFACNTWLTPHCNTQGGEEGFLSLRKALPEQFDRAAIEAVLAEWFKTLADLPAGLRMAVEMVRVARKSRLVLCSPYKSPAFRAW